MTIIIIIGILVLIAFFIGSTYNELVVARNRVKNQWAHIDTQLQRRFDLVPNLVETVKGFAEHEKQIIEKVNDIVKEYHSTSTNKEKLNIDEQLNSLLKSLYLVAEKYPILKSNVQFLKLQNSLAEIEEDISYARQFYNDAVTIYNDKLMSFPNNLIASMFHFKEEPLFDAFKNNDQVPHIHFKTTCPICGATITKNSSHCEYCGCDF